MNTNLWRTLVAVSAMCAVAAVPVLAKDKTPPGPNYQAAVDAAYAKFKDTHEGKNADYIPALAKVDPNVFGVALVTADGKVYSAGDLTTEVSIQSISKVFTMAQVMNEQGPDAIYNNIGVDATGMRFNSIVSVEQSKKMAGKARPGGGKFGGPFGQGKARGPARNQLELLQRMSPEERRQVLDNLDHEAATLGVSRSGTPSSVPGPRAPAPGSSGTRAMCCLTM